MRKILIIYSLFLVACKSEVETIKPSVESITESVYASGTIKSKNQYQVFATVNGIIQELFVTEGDTIKKGGSILSISNEAQRLAKENAELAATFTDFNNNQEKLNEAKQFVNLSKAKLKNDSALFNRQQKLWSNQVGTQLEFEARQLAYENAKTAYYSATVKYNDLKRQLDFTSSQSKKNLLISSKLERDFLVKSEINGVVYGLNKEVGEIVGPQSPLAVIGDAKSFVLDMQVDEYDILKVKKGLKVLITMDSYKGKVFEAMITKIDPLMNERSKSFTVEAEFVNKPPTLYPNVTFEANIMLQVKQKTLLIPRNYMLNDSVVILKNGEHVVVKTGLKDYQKIEIIKGLTSEDELQKPTE